jgi:hypothetical protein
MRALRDTFNSTKGFFDGWDATIAPWVTGNKHVDLRSFYNYDIARARTQEELDALTQEQLDAMTQRSIERAIVTRGEFWSVTGDGFVESYDWNAIPDPIPAGSPTCGAIVELDGWRGLTLTTTTDAFNVDIASSIPVDTSIEAPSAIDISEAQVGAGALLSLLIDGDMDFADFTAADSYIKLSSATDGGFGDTDFCTADIALDENTSLVDTELLIPMSVIVAAAGASFDTTQVRGVRLHLEGSAGAADRTVHLLALRVLADDWTLEDVDMETRRGILYSPPMTSEAAVPLVRGIGDDEDFRLTDGTIEVFFCTGGASAFSQPNSIALLIRESVVADVLTRITFGWDDTTCTIAIVREDAGIPLSVDEITRTYDIALDRAVDERIVDESGTDVGYGIDDDAGRYCLRVTAIGNTIEVRLLPSDANNAITGATVAALDATKTSLLPVHGRVGIESVFLDRDAFIDEIRSGSYGYATLRTLPAASYTPVDGAQLIASASPPENLFQSWSWLLPQEEAIDYSNTRSGLGSSVATTGLMSNPIWVRDWTKTTVSFDLWVTESDSDRVPFCTMQGLLADENGDPIEMRIPLPRLRANQWNPISIDLARFANLHTGIWYIFTIEGRGEEFAVDSMHIDQVAVDWAIRADEDQPWRSFGTLVNAERGAVHLGRERGRAIQLQATALTREAWVSHLRLLPRYAQLGLPLYDQSRDRRP